MYQDLDVVTLNYFGSLTCYRPQTHSPLDTPQGKSSLDSTHTLDGQQVGGTHPTGMLSCLKFKHIKIKRMLFSLLNTVILICIISYTQQQNTIQGFARNDNNISS